MKTNLNKERRRSHFELNETPLKKKRACARCGHIFEMTITRRMLCSTCYCGADKNPETTHRLILRGA